MGRYSGKQCRMISMLILTVSFFLVEIIVGHIVNSVALVADSFHMLSDVVALSVGFASIKISKRGPNRTNTFGWVRAEVLGALINAVFLIALCFSIFVRAIQRIISPEKIEKPVLMLIVGGLGLAINVAGLFLFHGHGHSHGGHSHAEAEPLKDSTKTEDQERRESAESDEPLPSPPVKDVDTVSEHSGHSHDSKKSLSSSAQLNMRGVFLHVLGDALGSVIVIVSALIIWLVEGDSSDSWKYKLDPAMSILMVVIILCTTVPLLRETGHILLQRVPAHLNVKELKRKLLDQVDGVDAVHEFHIWQLAGHRIIVTAHIHMKSTNFADYVRILKEVKDFFHREGIHSSTIQPELTEDIEGDFPSSDNCILECGPDKSCHTKTCCVTNTKKEANGIIGPEQENNIV